MNKSKKKGKAKEKTKAIQKANAQAKANAGQSKNMKSKTQNTKLFLKIFGPTKFEDVTL